MKPNSFLLQIPSSKCKPWVHTFDPIVGRHWSGNPEDSSTSSVIGRGWKRGVLCMLYRTVTHPDSISQFPRPRRLLNHRKAPGVALEMKDPPRSSVGDPSDSQFAQSKRRNNSSLSSGSIELRVTELFDCFYVLRISFIARLVNFYWPNFGLFCNIKVNIILLTVV